MFSKQVTIGYLKSSEKPEKGIEMRTKFCSAAVSSNPKSVLITICDLSSFHHTGKILLFGITIWGEIDVFPDENLHC